MINREEMTKITSLAKLSVREDELDALLEDMRDILSVAESVADIDLTQQECKRDEPESRLRADKVEPSLAETDLLGGALGERDGYYMGLTRPAATPGKGIEL